MVNSTCARCGAPWAPDVTGACRYCRVVERDEDGSRRSSALDPIGLQVLLSGLLIAGRADGHPLDRLAEALGPALGQALQAGRKKAGRPVDRIDLTIGDWVLGLRASGGGEAAHTVRGIVLKREALSDDEWVDRAAAALAERSGRDGTLRAALVDLDGRP